MMFFAYLLASQPHGTLYVGMTDDLIRRVWEHKMKLVPGFTAKYGVGRLVWFEAHQTREAAWRREKQIKEWRRAWKIELIERDNPQWIDLYPSLSSSAQAPRKRMGGSRLSPGLRSGGSESTLAATAVGWVPAKAGTRKLSEQRCYL